MFRLFFMLFSLYSGAMFASSVDCIQVDGKDVACTYSTFHKDASDLQADVRRSLRAKEISLNDDLGYVEKGNADYILEFYHDDPAVLALMKALVVKLDSPPIPPDRRQIFVEVNYYYFSNQQADERGFSLDFLYDGLVTPDLPKASLSGGGLGIQFGNLTNHWFGLNIDYGRNQSIINYRETVKFDTHDGKKLSVGEKTRIYRDAGIDTQTEDAVKEVGGKVYIDPNDSRRIYIKDFKLEYPTIVNNSYSILSMKTRRDEYLELKDGEIKVLLQQEVKEFAQTEEGKILGFKDGDSIQTYKFIATVQVKVGKRRAEKTNSVLYDEHNSSFFYSEKALDGLPKIKQELDEVVGSQFLDLGVYKSPFGVLGNGIKFQFVPKQLSSLSLSLPVKWEIYGDAIDTKKVVRLENLVAGPSFISDFDAATVREKLKDSSLLKVMMRISIDQEIASIARAKGMRQKAIDYFMYYYPNTGDLMLIDTKIYKNKAPKISLKKTFKRTVRD